ncbi:MAG: hypothetical protein ACREQB_01750, partial [Candidatus Binataceae bacterium]
MNDRRRTFGRAAIVMAGVAIFMALPLIAHATHSRRLAANFTAWDGSEISTDNGTGDPLNFYTKTVTVPLSN